MKRVTSILLIIGILISSSISYASVSDKLRDHWANNLIDRTFLAYYFPYLAKDNFERFEPNGSISDMDFSISLASLLKEYNFNVSGIGSSSFISRSEMVDRVGNKLLEIGLNNTDNNEIPFKDINTMSASSIELLRLLYNNNIIVGDSNSSFSPDRYLSQVEAILILQRVKEVLENMNTIAFNTTGIVQSYNSQEEIIVKPQDDKVIVTITKEFPNPGYSMSVSRIKKEGDKYRIYFQITPPSPNSMQLQVITYKTLTIEIDKDLLDSPPYNFILDGYNRIPVNRA